MVSFLFIVIILMACLVEVNISVNMELGEAHRHTLFC